MGAHTRKPRPWQEDQELKGPFDYTGQPGIRETLSQKGREGGEMERERTEEGREAGRQ